MKLPLRVLFLLACALALTAGKKAVQIPPCECSDMRGEARWAAKTDPQPAPINTAALQRITPDDMYALPVPSEQVTDTRLAAEQQWYAMVCRIVAIKIEDDGDLHIEVENTTGGSARVVVELPCGPTWCDMRKHVIEWTRANLLKRGRLERAVLGRAPRQTLRY